MRQRFQSRMILAGCLMVVGSASPAWCQTQSPKQSPARPYGLNIVAPVMAAGSDAASAAFQANTLPNLTQFVNSTAANRTALQNAGAIVLDPSQITLAVKADVRTYFVSEGADFHNSLGFNTQGGAVAAPGSKLIFPDVSSNVASYVANDKTKRTTDNPLLPGDFVGLGTFNAGAKLDFFLIANGANGGTDVFSTNTSLNKDGVSHVMAYTFSTPGSSYLILSFEDTYGGGDKDYNDAIFAIDIGAANVRHLIASVPEPGVVSLICAFGGTLALAKRRRRMA